MRTDGTQVIVAEHASEDITSLVATGGIVLGVLGLLVTIFFLQQRDPSVCGVLSAAVPC